MPKAVTKKEVLTALDNVENHSDSLPISNLNFEEAIERMIAKHLKGDKKSVVNCAYHIARIESRKWFNFGVLEDISHSEDGRGVVIINKNGLTLQCNTTDKTFNMYANLIRFKSRADAIKKDVVLQTSAFGDWDPSEWFDMIQVSFK